MNSFAGLICDASTLAFLSDAQSRSLSPENPTGEIGKGGMALPEGEQHPARDLGQGWKVRPLIHIEPGETAIIADVDGPGAIQSFWLTGSYHPRFMILRIYWDDQEQPSVEVPLGDFFCNPWGKYIQLTSAMVCVNPGSIGASNCFWPMPFRKYCRMTLENRGPSTAAIFYQINYSLAPVPDYVAYFHAQWRRTNPVRYKDVYTILDGVTGRGHYAGTYLAWGVNNNGWWGEGENKFYMDGDKEFPTICGTGTEDYFLGGFNFENNETKQYQEYSTPYAGLPQVLRPDGLYNSQQRFGMYRWHVPDPIRFKQDLRVTIQDLGWRTEGLYLPQQSDIASVAFWYQTLPTAPFPALPANDFLEII
jgi:hypothetical protein